jgi:hypothetical protein
MQDPRIYALFLALIILSCMILVLVLVLLLHYSISRHRKRQSHTDSPVETNLPIQLVCHTEIPHPHYYGQDRLSHLTTVAPSIELLPEIRTSSERAEDWLERRDSRMADGGLDMKKNKSLGTKKEDAITWSAESMKGEIKVTEADKRSGETRDMKEQKREDSVAVVVEKP